MNSLIIGYGEIGKSIEAVIGKSQVYDTEIDEPVSGEIDILHIAFPYSKDFIKFVKNYQDLYKPDLTIVYSTVPIGTCEEIGADVVHSPIEGRHPHLEESVRYSSRWLGCKDRKALNKAMRFWDELVFEVKYLKSSRYTEFLKLRSTAKYAVNLVWTDYEKRVADDIGMPFQHVKDFDEDYNDLYSFLGEFGIRRYILDPPNGQIGGHCLIPNAKLLNEQFPNEWLEKVIEMEIK